MFGGKLGAFHQGLELGPGNLGMAYPGAQTAIYSGDDTSAA
jgi:hypothetical protein